MNRHGSVSTSANPKAFANTRCTITVDATRSSFVQNLSGRHRKSDGIFGHKQVIQPTTEYEFLDSVSIAPSGHG